MGTAAALTTSVSGSVEMPSTCTPCTSKRRESYSTTRTTSASAPSRTDGHDRRGEPAAAVDLRRPPDGPGGRRCGSSRQLQEDLGREHRDVARAHRDHEVAGARHARDHRGHLGPARHEADVLGRAAARARPPARRSPPARGPRARRRRRARPPRRPGRARRRTRGRTRACASTGAAGTPRRPDPRPPRPGRPAAGRRPSWGGGRSRRRPPRPAARPRNSNRRRTPSNAARPSSEALRPGRRAPRPPAARPSALSAMCSPGTGSRSRCSTPSRRQDDAGAGPVGPERDRAARRPPRPARRCARGSRGSRAVSASAAAPGSSTQVTRVPPGDDAAEELVERGDVGGGAAVVVEVVGLDVRDDRDLGRERQERRVALVGLGDEDVAGALVGAGAGGGEVAADRERRVEAAVLQRDGEHRRGGGLARGAGDGGQPAPAGQRGERRGAVLDGEAALAGGGELGVALPDRGGHHDGGGRLGQVRRRRARRAPPRPAPGARARWPTPGRRSPVTRSPRASRMRAIPLIPAPPMPMKWTVTPPRLLCACAAAAHVEDEVGESFGGVGVPGRGGPPRPSPRAAPGR